MTVALTDDRLSLVFGALADPTRRAIVARLAEGEATVAELAAPFAMSQPAVSRHLRVLEGAGLVSGRRQATARPRRLEAETLREATDWLERYRRCFEERHDRLDELLADLEEARGGDGDGVSRSAKAALGRSRRKAREAKARSNG